MPSNLSSNEFCVSSFVFYGFEGKSMTKIEMNVGSQAKTPVIVSKVSEQHDTKTVDAEPKPIDTEKR